MSSSVPVSRERRTRTTTAALRHRGAALRRLLAAEDRGRLLLLTLLTLLAAYLMVEYSGVFTASSLMIPVLLSDMLLTPRRVPRFMAFLVAVLVIATLLEFEVWRKGLADVPARRWISLGIVVVAVAIVLRAASRRTRLGVGGLTVDTMLLDLQERIARQGALPELPAGWYAEMATRSAGDTSFAGDFVVAHHDPHRAELSVVVVDVSGKGVDAGTRSLVLSGAFAALLGSSPADAFLPEANAFVLRQGWAEDFATAVQLTLDLRTGDYTVRSAGHPPAVLYHRGAGRWEVLAGAAGPLLGMTRDAEYAAARGRLDPGDAFFLYTDGLVERPRRDIGMGIDRLVGEAERLLGRGLKGSARALVDRLGTATDDCALVLLQRERMTGIEPA